MRPVEERYAERFQEDAFDEEMTEAGLALRRRSAELGFYAAYMPEEVGGGGLSNLGYTLLVEAGATSGLRFGSFALGPPNPAAPNPIRSGRRSFSGAPTYGTNRTRASRRGRRWRRARCAGSTRSRACSARIRASRASTATWRHGFAL